LSFKDSNITMDEWEVIWMKYCLEAVYSSSGKWTWSTLGPMSSKLSGYGSVYNENGWKSLKDLALSCKSRSRFLLHFSWEFMLQIIKVSKFYIWWMNVFLHILMLVFLQGLSSIASSHNLWQRFVLCLVNPKKISRHLFF